MANIPSGFGGGEDPYHFVMRVLMSKWKPMILTAIYFDNGTTRFGQFSAGLPLSNKVLTENLRILEEDGLIYREQYPEIPPRVEYHLTALGESAIPLLFDIYKWGWNMMKETDVPIDLRGQMFHGYVEADPQIMNMPIAQYMKWLQDQSEAEK